MAGLQASGVDAEIFQIPETLDEELLKQIHAPPKPDLPIMTPEKMVEYDGFIFGLPTRFGNIPSQFSNFFETTSTLWATGALAGKYAGVFVTTAAPNSGLENTIRTVVTYLAHQGIIFVPLGYKNAFSQLTNLEEVHSGAPWGGGAFASSDGSRMPSVLEKEISYIQGKTFGETLQKSHGLSIDKSDPASVQETAQESSEVENPPVKNFEPAKSRTAQASPVVEEKKSKKLCGICAIM